jgi:hypothetical protein
MQLCTKQTATTKNLNIIVYDLPNPPTVKYKYLFVKALSLANGLTTKSVGEILPIVCRIVCVLASSRAPMYSDMLSIVGDARSNMKKKGGRNFFGKKVQLSTKLTKLCLFA